MLSDSDFAPRGQTVDRSIPRFHMRPVEIPFKSKEIGRPFYEDREFVEIITPGNSRSMPCEPVNDQHKLRWPNQYAAFKAGQEEAPLEGTPLEEMPGLSPSIVLNLKGVHIKTVEQLAGVSDAEMQNMGLGGRELRTKAKRFLEAASSIAPVQAAEARAERAEAENAHLKTQIADLGQRLESLENKRRGGRPRAAVEAEAEED